MCKEKAISTQKSYLAAARRDKLSGATRRVFWRPPEEIYYLAAARSYLAAARRVIWRPPEEKSYLAAARREELSGGRQKSYLLHFIRVTFRLP